MRSSPLHGLLEAAAREAGDRVALRAQDASWTFDRLAAASSGIARDLARHGVGAGDRVALMTGTRPEFLAAVYGISKLGAAAVLLSPAWKSREVGHALTVTRPTHAIADGLGVGVLADVWQRDRVTDLDDPSAYLAALLGDGPPLPPATITADSEAVLVFSSGTTGLPKAVRHTHGSLQRATRHWVTALGLGPDDRFQVATPAAHILGLLNLLAATAARATVRMHRRFDLEEILARIAHERMTLEMAVAPIALALANHPRLEDYDLSSLRYIMWGATPVAPGVAQRVTERTGVRWLAAYGASEVPVIAANPIDRPEQWRLDSVGLPPSEVRLRVVDLDNGSPLPSGGMGEIQVRGPSTMAGYLPESPPGEAFADGGWYRTGDVGWLEPDGWVHLTDRCKEMIKVNGFQVAPAEIEAVLHGHPAIADCAVFGVPDERAGEVPVAAVVLDSVDSPLSGDDVRQLVAASLASYKQLRDVVVVDAIPRLPSGKVLRRMLRDEWVPRLAAGVGT